MKLTKYIKENYSWRRALGFNMRNWHARISKDNDLLIETVFARIEKWKSWT